jgi:transcriptional regulator with XRE-family HTH domain
MMHPTSYLRSHRKRSGMSLAEAARILGYGHSGEVSRHERLTSVPSLRVALRYEVLYRVPIRKLFPGLFEEEQKEVEERLSALFEECSRSSARGRTGAMIARKLEWAWERANEDQGALFDLPEHA